MANVFNTDLLATGELTTTKTEIYASPLNTKTIIKNLICVNKDSVARIINLYVKESAGTSRYLTPVNLSLGGGFRVDFADENLTLGAGDSIEGEADMNGFIDFSIHGVKET